MLKSNMVFFLLKKKEAKSLQIFPPNYLLVFFFFLTSHYLSNRFFHSHATQYNLISLLRVLYCISNRNIQRLFLFFQSYGVNLIVSKISLYLWDLEFKTSFTSILEPPYGIPSCNNLVSIEQGLQILERIIKYSKRSRHSHL